jgi:hypothetical protein
MCAGADRRICIPHLCKGSWRPRHRSAGSPRAQAAGHSRIFSGSATTHINETLSERTQVVDLVHPHGKVTVPAQILLLQSHGFKSAITDSANSPQRCDRLRSRRSICPMDFQIAHSYLQRTKPHVLRSGAGGRCVASGCGGTFPLRGRARPLGTVFRL